MSDYPKADYFDPPEFVVRSCSKCESLTARLAAAEADVQAWKDQCSEVAAKLAVMRLTDTRGRARMDRIDLVAWVLRNMYEFGCFTGDCPHDLNSECIQSIVQQYEEDEAAKGWRDE